MCPPSSGWARLARTTIASAFQRTIDDALLEFEVARELRLLGELDRVLVRRVEHGGQRHAPHAGVIEKLSQEKSRALPALGRYQRVEGLQPFAGFGRVGVGRVDAPEGRRNDVGYNGHAGMVIFTRAGASRRFRHYMKVAVI